MGLELTFPKGGALVAGGTGNVGAGITRRLVVAGTSVVFTYLRDEARAKRLEDDLRGQGLDATAQRMDMSDDGSIAAAVEAVVAKTGRLHAVACAAGARVPFSRMADLTPEQVSAYFNEDGLGCFRLIRGALPALRAGGGGTITICTTLAIRRVIKFDGVSPFSKAALEALIRQLADEEARYNIRCNSVPIGWVSDYTAADFDGFAKMMPDGENFGQLVAQLKDIVRLGGGPSAPDNVGNLFAYLASDQSAFITGQSIAFDGGATL